MVKNCLKCAEKCPQAEMAHEAALGRMYATNELLSLLKKVESGVLVEVVRCKDCMNGIAFDGEEYDIICKRFSSFRMSNEFCSYGERKEDAKL